MKFRVETWDTTQQLGEDWRLVRELTNEPVARMMFEAWREQCPPTEIVRLLYKSKVFGWAVDSQAYGTKETKPMASRVVYDCGCAGCGDDWYPCCEAHGQKHERTKPMSTKQRGDVERIEGETRFRIWMTTAGGVSDFTHDEFRRIWEAGNAEFAQLGMAAVYGERLAEKDAEIARLKENAKFQYNRAETIQRLNREQVEEIRKLKAEVARLRKLATENADLHVRAEAEIVRLKAGLDKCQERNLDHTAENAKLKAQLTAHEGSPCQWYKPMCEAQCEVARLRGWLEWIKESSKHFDPPNGRCESAMDAAWRALAGKKVPE